MANWHKRFMDLADHVATWSKDRSTQVGAVIASPDSAFFSVGYNGFPRGANDDVETRHERPEKYLWAEHAERNAIYNCARSGHKLLGYRIYVPWFPCMDCARAIVQSGISTVIYKKLDSKDGLWLRWKDSCARSMELFLETNVDMLVYDPRTEEVAPVYWSVNLEDNLLCLKETCEP